jgi:hypothetical protein
MDVPATASARMRRPPTTTHSACVRQSRAQFERCSARQCQCLIAGRNPDDRPLSAAVLVVVAPAVVVAMGTMPTESVDRIDEASSSESPVERSAPEVELRSAEGGGIKAREQIITKQHGPDTN